MLRPIAPAAMLSPMRWRMVSISAALAGRVTSSMAPRRRGRMAHQEGRVERRRRLIQGVPIRGKGRKAVPFGEAQQVQRRRRPVFKDQRRKADPAVAGDDGGHPLAHLGRHVPHGKQRPIVVGVGIDEARRHNLVRRVDRQIGAGIGEVAQRANAIVDDGHIGAHTGGAGAVDDNTTEDGDRAFGGHWHLCVGPSYSGLSFPQPG